MQLLSKGKYKKKFRRLFAIGTHQRSLGGGVKVKMFSLVWFNRRVVESLENAPRRERISD